MNISDDVFFAGVIKNPFPYLSRADAFVVSSIYEGLSMVIVEALACGCPVVSTDCPNGPAEILENGKYGKLVPVANPAALATAIEETLFRPPDKQKSAERANYFHVDRAVDSYLELFKKLIRKN